jgi:hypothetical protein
MIPKMAIISLETEISDDDDDESRIVNEIIYFKKKTVVFLNWKKMNQLGENLKKKHYIKIELTTGSKEFY